MIQPERPAVHTFDLSAALEHIPIEHPLYGVVVRCLRNLEATSAILTDLGEAKQAVTLAARMSPMPQSGPFSSDTPLICEALFVHALMLYCRALHSSSTRRHKVDVLGRYAAEQRKKHRLLTALRDKVIAHYGTGSDSQPVPWINDHVVLRVNSRDQKIEFSYPHMRAALKAATTADLTELIEVSISLVAQSGYEKQDKLARELLKLVSDQHLGELLRKYPFNEKAYFGRAMPPGSPNMRFVVPVGELPKD